MNWKPPSRPAPHGWGLNSLTDAFNMVRDNQYATFDRKQLSRELLLVDRILFDLLEGRTDPSPMFPLQFLLRGHSCYRATAACAMAGQVYEATVLQRAVLEAAAYGLYIGDDIERGVRWLRREDSATAKDKVRREFGFGSLKHDFEARYPELANLFDTLYDTLVDFGAHPNEAGFSISTSIRRGDDAQIIDTVYLHDDGLALDFGLKNTVRIGLWIVLVYRTIYPEWYADSGVAEMVDFLSARH